MFSTPPLKSIARDRLNERLECASERILAQAQVENVPPRGTKSNITPRSGASAMSTSTRKSMSARKKQLELEAARAKAKIEIQLIEKKLEADIAAMDEAEAVSRSGHSHVEEWLERSSRLQPSQVPQAEPAAAATASRAEQLAQDDSQQLAPALPVDSLLQVAQAIKDMIVSAPSTKEDRLLARLGTPRDLPVFSGDCVEWLHFKSAFEESTRACQFTAPENLWRLRRALKGDAKEAVTDLLIGNTSPDDIMKTLELRFGQSDLIIENLTYRIKKLSPLPVNYQIELVNFSTKINNCVSVLRALNKEDYLRSPELAAAVVSKLPSVMLSRWMDYAFPRLNKGKSKLELLATFLQKEAEMISVVGVVQKKPEHIDKKPESKARTILLTVKAENKCKFCKKAFHSLPDCRLFKRALRKERWRFVKANNLCFGCLLSERHDRSACTAPLCSIDDCGLHHSELLHFKKPTSQAPAPAAAAPRQALEPEDQEPSPSAAVALVAEPGVDSELQRKCDVVLKVVKVSLCSASGVTVNAYALLDDGAAVSMIDASLAQELGVKTFKSEPIKLVDAFGMEVYQTDAPKINVKISGHGSSKYYDIMLRQVNELKLPMQNLSVINEIKCKHLLPIKDFVCTECVVPRLLIGEDNYYLLAPQEILHGGKNEPYATKCRLGWSIHGCYGRTHSPVSGHTFFLDRAEQVNSGIDKLNDLIKQSFELDSIGISTLRRENKAHLRAVEILDSTARYLGQRWEVGLPFSKDTFTLPHSYEYALSRLRSLLKKCQADSAYADKYRREMEKLFTSGYARELDEEELSASQVWYLSHFGVQNPNKPGKLRLVFDCAGKVNDLCLNDFLLTGPDLYNSLLGIMLRFREHAFVIIGDIKEMFLQIKIRREDQNYLRFLWQKNPDDPIKVCAMQSLIFGATCSPFIAQYIKNKNALKYQDLYPEAVDVIVNNHYMDDCLYSCASEERAVALVQDITTIHKKGGFEITRWSSNSKQVLRALPLDALAPTAIEFKHGSNNTMERTLGLTWYPSDDTFGFKISLERILTESVSSGSEPPTKAKMLGVIMSVYDLHGFLSPFIIKGKILFQNVHRSGVDWNCRIQPAEHTAWVDWLNELKQLGALRIPRCYMTSAWTACYEYNESSSGNDYNNNILDRQMHIFCDASLKAYSAVIYWRFTRSDGRVLVCFAVSKSRVSPLRPISIPRLELQGALLGARLAKTLADEHRDIKPTKRYFWADSSTVLQWIRSDPRIYKPYVAHRLGEIDEFTKSYEWRYVPTSLNTADIATREVSPPLKYSDAWFQGPAFLRQPEEDWPKDRMFTKLSEEVKCEERSVHAVFNDNSDLFLPNENNISSWIKLVRATARVLLFIRKCQRKDVQLDVHLMKEAEDLLLRKSQEDSFRTELSSLKQGKPLASNSRLLQLSPYLDNGILRVGGRIDKVSGVERPTVRPAILDGQHRISHLLVEYHHKKALHGANELVVNQLRQQYWILKLRPTVRTVSARCLFCRYRRATPQPQRMADLPAARLQHNRRPFSYSGVDFFGPMEVTVGRRRLKRYGMLFTCLTVRAIHIELTEDLTADSTILGLRRMAARRGLPLVLYSDNGTNLRAADAELKRNLEELNINALQEDGAIRGVEWRFIPPGAPEMGGAWERMIRTVKTALKVILKERAPHPDTLVTLLAEVEAIVNSRPITHVSTDPSYPEALTPNHFLIGTSSNGPTFGRYNDRDLCLRKRWRIAQRLADMFWGRWIREYLPTLLPRQKWTQESRALQVGDYVILVEPNLERGSWRHGVVSATHAGADGRVRIVDVRTRTGSLRRPVTRVALLSPHNSNFST